MTGRGGDEIPGLAAGRLWAASRFPYLASGLFGAQVMAKPGIGTVAVDDNWRLHADPELTAGWTAAELGSVLVHHVSHLLRAHGERAGAVGVSDDDAQAWVRGADAEINDDLVAAGLDLPGRPVLPADLGAPPGLLAEQYFVPGQRHGQLDWDLDCGSGADGLGRPWDQAGQPGLSQWQARLLCRQVAQDCIRHAKEPGTVPPACSAGPSSCCSPWWTGAGCWPPNCAGRWRTPRARWTTRTGGHPGAPRWPARWCCPRCAGRCPRSRWSATRRAA